ncbi:hypothetical protein ARMSODRAFT_554181 [Armillaria solidipes]|uniref:Uncharacterized protein n=1 Tax=Armillaria solidipes TaxID=1076256 RepID=A0A2H3AWR3_9AGAR|nr:hypothetical protein ARMSODRAFT_554181 [Armillaria solidipes]
MPEIRPHMFPPSHPQLCMSLKQPLPSSEASLLPTHVVVATVVGPLLEFWACVWPTPPDDIGFSILLWFGVISLLDHH